MKFCKPNLPSGKVKTVIISGEYSYIVSELNRLGVDVITTSPCNSLPIPEQFHADMQCSYYHRGIAVVDSSCNDPLFVKKLTNRGIKIEKQDISLSSAYPQNIWLNHFVLGNKLVGNIHYIPSTILSYCKYNNFDIINVKQGYTKCSCAIVSQNAIITSDSGIVSACKDYDIDVLQIRSGSIVLPKYNYGFIGGCCGKLSNDILAFTGRISEHPDYDKIKAFLQNHKINIYELSNKPLLDIGSILPIKECD